MVFYRKYRPQKIEDLDSQEVRQSLFSIFSNGKSNVHAFLFTGPKGLGKTSSARIVAKVINCERLAVSRQSLVSGGKDKLKTKDQLPVAKIEPCNKCSQCLSITSGNNLDVLEIDGASNRGIDEIRDLKEKINLAPFKASKKIYIIDEVHMLTTEAFNALLKTLEEPPSHAVFILCTTEIQKVPATIASRCFRVNFTRATNDELVRSMQRIVKAEDIKIEKEALLEIAKLSDGSFRDGSKILEEVLSFAGRKTITANLVNEKYNMLGIGQSVTEMLEALAKKDMKKGFLICQNLVKQGMDFKYFIEQLVDRLHFLLLVKVGVEEVPDVLKGETFESLTIDEIKKLFEILSEAYQDTKYAVLAQAPLELAVLEWTEGGKGEPSAQSVRAVGIPSIQATSSVSPRADESNGFFLKFIDEVKQHNNLLAGVLRGCSANEIKDGNLEIIARSKFHKEKLEEAKSVKILEEVAEKLSKEKINVKIIQGG
nr:DNA polymerase III subunit gamma/tau [Candidatus Levybacteria bacterium]